VQGAARHDLLLTGRQALAEAGWEKARECFERALELGEGPDAMDGLAQALQWLGQYHAAIAMREAAFPAYRRRGWRPRPARRHERLRSSTGRSTDWNPRAGACMAAITLARGDAGLAKDLVERCLGGEDGTDPAWALILDLLLDLELARGQRTATNETLDLLHRLPSGPGNERARA